jgi:arylsulfatase A-like enzyme
MDKIMEKKSPNIVLIITDQQRTDTLGFRGDTPCRTPNMDRIAQEGISFDRAICPSPLCSPSRLSIFTGEYPHQYDMLRNNGTLPAEPILTDSLKALGYYTAYAGKWHLEPAGQPKAFRGREKELGLDRVHKGEAAPKGQRVIDRWFDDAYGQGTYDYSMWCEENGLPDGWYVSDPDVRTHRKPSMSIPKPKRMELEPSQTYDAWVTDIAIDYLDKRPMDQPFFLVCGYFGPHPPFHIPEPYFSMYDPADAIMPPNFGPQPDEPRSNGTSFYRQLFEDHGNNWEAWRESVATYWGYCTMMDDYVGRILTTLEDQEILDDTLVIFCSDHGEMMGGHGLWHKMMAYEEALRVPLLMRLPGTIDPGIRNTANVSLIDLPATILSLVGEDIPAQYFGRDLSPTFNGGVDLQDDGYRFSEHKPLGEWHRTVEWRMVTDNHYKYVWNHGDIDELFDLERDPYEMDNLIDDAQVQDELLRLKARLKDWMVESNDPLLDAFPG